MDQSTSGAGVAINSAQEIEPKNSAFHASNEVLSPLMLMLSFPIKNPGLANNVGSDTFFFLFLFLPRVIRKSGLLHESTGQTAQTTSSRPSMAQRGNRGRPRNEGFRPANARPVMYWALREGNGNRAQGFGQGNLYICTATNTWTLYTRQLVIRTFASPAE